MFDESLLVNIFLSITEIFGGTKTPSISLDCRLRIITIHYAGVNISYSQACTQLYLIFDKILDHIMGLLQFVIIKVTSTFRSISCRRASGEGQIRGAFRVVLSVTKLSKLGTEPWVLHYTIVAIVTYLYNDSNALLIIGLLMKV